MVLWSMHTSRIPFECMGQDKGPPGIAGEDKKQLRAFQIQTHRNFLASLQKSQNRPIHLNFPSMSCFRIRGQNLLGFTATISIVQCWDESMNGSIHQQMIYCSQHSFATVSQRVLSYHCIIVHHMTMCNSTVSENISGWTTVLQWNPQIRNGQSKRS